MKKFLNWFLIFCMIFALVAGVFNFTKNAEKAKAYSYSTNNLASDGGFVNVNALDTAGIQNILNSAGGFLAGYSEGGRSAAQIIHDASHGYNEASGSISGITIDTNTGTVNPIAILATLQKEQSLVYMKDNDPDKERALNCAMGYDHGMGCQWMFDNYPGQKGFTNQVEWGAWQLRYSYERASGHGFSDYQVGQSQIIGDTLVTFANRATASLYRYTPGVSFNFSLYFNQWGGNGDSYTASWAGQNPITPGTTSTFNLAPGQSRDVSITYKNTGSSTWDSNVRLGVSTPADRVFYDPSWMSEWRLATAGTVAPGEYGTFSFKVTAPANMAPGSYRMNVKLVRENVRWMDETLAWWVVNVQ